MNISEFSTQFDVLYNNITSNQAPGLNEYEKSVFLTKAQSQLLNEYFNSRVDGVGGGFDGSQRRQYDFSSIIKVSNLPYISNASDARKIDRRSIVYAFPEDYFLSVNEILYDGEYQYSVLPISYAEYTRLMLKPYNFPVKRGAWRLMTGSGKYNEYRDDNGYAFASPVYGNLPLKLTIYKSINPSLTNDSDIYGGGSVSIVSNRGDHPSNIINLTAQYPDFSNIYLYFTVKEDEYDDKIIAMAKELFDFIRTKYVNHQLPEGNRFVLLGKALGWLSSLQAPIGMKTFSSSGKTMEAEIKENSVTVEIIGKFNGAPTYQLRYVRKPKPIILEDLSEGNYGNTITIDGFSEESERCELPEETHQEILERAVTLAKIAWQGGTATQAAASQKDNKD